MPGISDVSDDSDVISSALRGIDDVMLA